MDKLEAEVNMREIDVQVAKYVFGFDYKFMSAVVHNDGEWFHWKTVPHYTTDWRYAGQVYDKMASEQSWLCSVHSYSDSTGSIKYVCKFGYGIEIEDTPQLAICVSAVKYFKNLNGGS